MGILTIMKLGVFAMSVLSLLVALTWIIIYCPTRIYRPDVMVRTHVEYDPSENLPLKDYFDYHEKKLNEDLKNGKAVHGFFPKFTEANKKKEIIIPTELFGDDAFDSMVNQLDHEELKGYEFLASSQNVTIYRIPRGDKGLYEYKLYAYLPDATPDEISGVFLDNKYRLEWDEYVTDLYVVQKNEKGPNVVYFNVDFPFPLANRDYVYAREVRNVTRNGEPHIVIVMHSVKQHGVPEVRGAIRVSDYHQSLAMKKVGKHGTKAFIQYFDDPKGNLPSWLVNWAAKSGVPAFLKDLQRACAGLEPYKKKHKIP